MTTQISPEAEEDLDQAYAYYEKQLAGLGDEFLHEFRRAVDRVIQNPTAWQLLDDTFRRRRLDRFPYGIVYSVNANPKQIEIVAVMHLSQRPGFWRRRIS